VIAGLTGEWSDTAAIVVIVVLNAVIGFVQEFRAEKAMAALKKMAARETTVLRDGLSASVPAASLVPGDLVLLEAGNIVPADLRLTEAARLKIEEAALTGESVPADKETAALKGRDLPLGDRKNMAYKGTVVTYGRGAGVGACVGGAPAGRRDRERAPRSGNADRRAVAAGHEQGQSEERCDGARRAAAGRPAE